MYIQLVLTHFNLETCQIPNASARYITSPFYLHLVDGHFGSGVVVWVLDGQILHA